MGHIYAYAKDADDLSTTGLVGALVPTEASVAEIADEEYSVTMSHPYDPAGKWRALVEGNVLSVPCRVRTTPNISGGQVVGTVEEWAVKATASKAQRGVFNKAKKGKRKSTLAPGAQVIMIKAGEERYQIKAAKVTGWMAKEALEYVLTETLPEGSDGIEAVLPSVAVRPQLFDIRTVQKDTDAGTITVYAKHISYRAEDTLITYQNPAPLTAQAALNGIMAGRDFDNDNVLYTDIGDSRTSVDWEDAGEIQALLDPETGFAKRWGAELIRDDNELYFLRRAGRRGGRIEHAKNLKAAMLDVDEANVVTAIKPRGVKKDGSLLYLTDDPKSPDNYILSPHADDYPYLRCAVLDCEDCTVDKKQVTVELARARMREQVARKFEDDKVDRPAATMRVDFVELASTQEYEHYQDLETVYMHDEVPVVAQEHGIEILAKVHKIEWDPLHERLTAIELGDLRQGVDSIYGWQLQPFPGGKILPGTTPGSALEDGAIPENKLDADLQEALNKAWADIEAAEERLAEYHTWLDGLEAQMEAIVKAVGDNAGNIAAIMIAINEIRAAVRNAEEDLAALTIRANQISMDVESAQGDIGTLKLSATEMATTITNQAAEISSVRQTANSLYSTIYGSGGLASQVLQLSDRVSVTLQDLVNGKLLKVSVGPATGIYGSTGQGIEIYFNGVRQGAIITGVEANEASSMGFVTPGYATVFGTTGAAIGCGMFRMEFDPSLQAALFNGDFLPFVGNSYDIGGTGARWRRIYSNNSLNTSDMRFKRDVAELNAAWLLRKLRPIRYRLTEAEEADGKLRFGFGVQDIMAAIEGTDIEDANLIDVSDPEHYNMSYTDLHALHVEGWQAHDEIIERQAELIEDLTRRLAALEGSDGHD